MEQLKSMKAALMAQACSQMGNLQSVDAEELGEVIDMIKDLEEAMYYCTIVEAMEKNKTNEEMMNRGNNTYYYTEKMMPYYPYCYDDYYYYKNKPNMYYSDGNSSDSQGGMTNGNNSSMSSNSSNGGNRSYSERELSWPMRDEREGRSPKTRRMYMEGKEMHKEQGAQMQELEKYMQELSQDVLEMIKDASPEERQLLQKKIALLSTKLTNA